MVLAAEEAREVRGDDVEEADDLLRVLPDEGQILLGPLETEDAQSLADPGGHELLLVWSERDSARLVDDVTERLVYACFH
ncbi:MAG: hypothetical protein R3E97_09930 [Candidatus Eisenbacteria bacterium]